MAVSSRSRQGFPHLWGRSREGLMSAEDSAAGRTGSHFSLAQPCRFGSAEGTLFIHVRSAGAHPKRREGMLLCPSCMVELTIAERQGVELDYCPQCRGVWLERGELDKIIDRSQAFTQTRDHDD